MRIMPVFDYAFFRVAKLYYRWDKKEAVTSIILISLAETMFIMDVLLIFFLELLNKERRMELSEYFILIALGFLAFFFLKNRKRYKNSLQEFDSKWGKESTTLKIFKGFLVLLLIVFPIAFPALLVNLKDYTLSRPKIDLHKEEKKWEEKVNLF